jgi:hypothetical protein
MVVGSVARTYSALYTQRVRYVNEAAAFSLCINCLLGGSTIYYTLLQPPDSYILLNRPFTIHSYRYLIVKRLGHLLEKPRIRPGKQDMDFLVRETL